MKKRNMFIMVCIMAVSIGLCACGKVDASASDMVSTEMQVSESESVEEIITEKAEETEAIETVEEVDAVIPEGIDLESGLSGEEWIQSFVGVVNEPVVVIYSDITDRKDVIMDGDKVHVNPETDWMGMYYPNGMIEEDENGEWITSGISGYIGTCYRTKNEENGYAYELYEADVEKMREYGVVEASAKNGDWRIGFRIIVD